MTRAPCPAVRAKIASKARRGVREEFRSIPTPGTQRLLLRNPVRRGGDFTRAHEYEPFQNPQKFDGYPISNGRPKADGYPLEFHWKTDSFPVSIRGLTTA